MNLTAGKRSRTAVRARDCTDMYPLEARAHIDELLRQDRRLWVMHGAGRVPLRRELAPADGNCYYHALADGLEFALNTRFEATALRARIAERLFLACFGKHAGEVSNLQEAHRAAQHDPLGVAIADEYRVVARETTDYTPGTLGFDAFCGRLAAYLLRQGVTGEWPDHRLISLAVASEFDVCVVPYVVTNPRVLAPEPELPVLPVVASGNVLPVYRFLYYNEHYEALLPAVDGESPSLRRRLLTAPGIAEADVVPARLSSVAVPVRPIVTSSPRLARSQTVLEFRPPADLRSEAYDLGAGLSHASGARVFCTDLVDAKRAYVGRMSRCGSRGPRSAQFFDLRDLCLPTHRDRRGLVLRIEVSAERLLPRDRGAFAWYVGYVELRATGARVLCGKAVEDEGPLSCPLPPQTGVLALVRVRGDRSAALSVLESHEWPC